MYVEVCLRARCVRCYLVLCTLLSCVKLRTCTLVCIPWLNEGQNLNYGFGRPEKEPPKKAHASFFSLLVTTFLANRRKINSKINKSFQRF